MLRRLPDQRAGSFGTLTPRRPLVRLVNSFGTDGILISKMFLDELGFGMFSKLAGRAAVGLNTDNFGRKPGSFSVARARSSEVAAGTSTFSFTLSGAL